jgi:Golgi apyrase
MGHESRTWCAAKPFCAHATAVQFCLPGLSSFADELDSVEQHLTPLLRHARAQIPPSLQKDTPIFLLATAGMRLLPPLKQAAVLRTACHFLRHHSNFRIDEPSDVGPCGSSVRIITGEEEGLFGWIAVNYLMDGFTGPSSNRTTYGFLDMGGASTQIAFEPKQNDRSLAKNLVDVRLRLLGGEEIHHQVFVTTWLGYGTNQARERYVGQIIEEDETSRVREPHQVTSEDAETIPDPCLHKGLERTELPAHVDPTTTHNQQAHRLRGTGSFEQCLQKTAPLLNKEVPCPDSPCLFNGVHVPPIDFAVSHFIGVSEYWYSSEHVFGLGGPYDFVQYERAASEFCSQPWQDVLKQHEESRHDGRLGGDGEVVEAGRVVDTGKWGKAVEISRLEAQCFKAAWIVNVLHEGIGMPRIVDPEGNATTSGEEVAEQADRKGLGRPTFQSVDAVGDIAISWTLGKMVLEASKEVTPSSKTARPLVDPLDDLSNSVDPPIKPIRPPFFNLDAIESQITQHLPSSLHRSSLGFSPVLFLVYAALLFVMFVVTCRLRNPLVASVRRLLHSRNKRDRDAVGKEYLMEEGKNFGSRNAKHLSSHLSSVQQIWHRIRRLLSGPRPAPLTISSQRSTRFGHDLRGFSPTLSSSLPGTPLANSFSHVASSSSSQYHSRSSSPVPGMLHDDNVIPSGLSSLSSRSRNASQHNLTLATLASRPGTLSRQASSVAGSLQEE